MDLPRHKWIGGWEAHRCQIWQVVNQAKAGPMCRDFDLYISTLPTYLSAYLCVKYLFLPSIPIASQDLGIFLMIEVLLGNSRSCWKGSGGHRERIMVLGMCGSLVESPLRKGTGAPSPRGQGWHFPGLWFFRFPSLI